MQLARSSSPNRWRVGCNQLRVMTTKTPAMRKKLVLKTITLRKLTPDEIGDSYGGACCRSMNCPPDPRIELTANVCKPNWSVSVSISVGPSKSITGVSVSAGPSYSFSFGP
jgi:hypothetical protein